MAYTRKPNYYFKTKTDTGIDKVPNSGIIIVGDYDGVAKTFMKQSNTGLTSTSTVADSVTALNLKDSSATTTTINEKLANLVSALWSLELIATSTRSVGSSNTQAYSATIERTDGVAVGIKQYGLIQQGINPTTGGHLMYVVPFQLNVSTNVITIGTPGVIWENTGNYFAQSTTSHYSDMKSGRFFGCGHNAYPGTTTHTMGTFWGTLTASNTVTGGGFSIAAGKDLYTNYNGTYTMIPSTSTAGSGWKGYLNGYMSSNGNKSTAFYVDFTGAEGAAPTTGVHIPPTEVGTSTHGGAYFLPTNGLTSASAAIGGIVNYLRLSDNVWVSRVYAPNSTTVFTEYVGNTATISGNVNNPMFVLSDGRVVVSTASNTTTLSNWYIYSAHNSRVQITNQRFTLSFLDPSLAGSACVATGVNTWLMGDAQGTNLYLVRFNTTTNTFERNTLLLPVGAGLSSYTSFKNLGNGKLLFVYRKNYGEVVFAVGTIPVMKTGDAYTNLNVNYLNYTTTMTEVL